MSNLPQSDWILAGRFVDGDLSASENAIAESRIDSDEDFAAAVEEIRSQSNLFAGLPNFKPTDDLQDRTLQASLDQVKAIMGAWPIESESPTVALAKSESTDSFDWKSTAALVASLAGIFLIGTMLWQNTFGPESGVALEDAAAAPAASRVQGKAAGVAADIDEESQIAAKEIDGNVFEKSVASKSFRTQPEFGAKSDLVEAEAADNSFGSRNMTLNAGPIMGTPAAMSPSQIAKSTQTQSVNEVVQNVSTPVEQIWCVSQDNNISKNAVCDILSLNQIQVQREEQPKPTYSNSEPVEAFYVAATPKQMKLAMSQISNSADIEMIMLPSGMNSPIADSVAQQFAQSEVAPSEPAQQVQSENVPPQFKEPATQALAQQLVSNMFPRNFVPPGPVPPILKSGTPIDGLDEEFNIEQEPQVEEADMEAMPQIALTKEASPLPSGMQSGVGGAGFGGGGGGNIQVQSPESVARAQQSTLSLPQQAELDKYLDDSDQRLRQYLILVRGGEGK